MTLRDYECQSCFAKFEAELDRDSMEVECPHCGSSDTLRLWRVPAVIYKGTGWYKTDNKSEANGGKEI